MSQSSYIAPLSQATYLAQIIEHTGQIVYPQSQAAKNRLWEFGGLYTGLYQEARGTVGCECIASTSLVHDWSSEVAGCEKGAGREMSGLLESSRLTCTELYCRRRTLR